MNSYNLFCLLCIDVVGRKLMLVTLATSRVNRREENINTARYPSLKVAPGSNSQSLVQIQTISGALASRSFKVCLTL